MNKIMFNDYFGLTEAVLKCNKTMTRRIVPSQYVPMIEDGLEGAALIEAQSHGKAYRDGEIVAVAQSYKDLGYTKEWVEQHISPNPNAQPTDPFEKKYPGWSNKMFVQAELNKAHQIRITDIKLERLQDISDIDCIKEGVRCFLDYGQERIDRFYIDACVKDAFAYLIDKVSGKGTWERNPWVFAYSFKLEK